MKKIFLLLLVLLNALFLSACKNSEKDPFEGATISSSGSIKSSSTGGISLKLGEQFRFLDSENKQYSSGNLGSLLEKTPYTIVYFYPKDGTPNCTIQALDFSIMKQAFLKKGFEIIGVSGDSTESHMKFAERNELKIKLLEDGSGSLLEQFANKGEEQTYGNGDDTTNIRRSTFIVDKNGTPVAAFHDITAKGHARRVYDFIEGLPK